MRGALDARVNANVSDIPAYIPVDSKIQSEITIFGCTESIQIVQSVEEACA